MPQSSTLQRLAVIVFSLLPVRSFGQTLEVRMDVHHDVSPAVRDLPGHRAPPTVRPEAEPVHAVPLPPGLKPPQEPDKDLQRIVGGRFHPALLPSAVPNLRFDGISEPHWQVPDANGAVGIDQYVEFANASFAVYQKSTGVMLQGPVPVNALFSGFGGPCQQASEGDGIVSYDRLANRWIISQYVFNSSPALHCVAVSQTSDAIGGYYLYSFQYPDENDYPKMAVWPDAYYVTVNLFSGQIFLGADACAYDRNAMLNGGSAAQICFRQPKSVASLLPADLDGKLPPPAGSPNYLVDYGSNSLNLYTFHVDFSNPVKSRFLGPAVIPVAPFTPLCANNGQAGNGLCVAQPSTPQRLTAISDRLMYRLAYRNFGDHESLVVNHSVMANTDTANSIGGIRWYEIRSPGSNPQVFQEGTWSPDSTTRWMGSIAMDQAGDILVGYSKSDGQSVFPSVAIAGRVPGDQLNTLEPELNLLSGSSAQTHTNRWGDYSSMQIDPVDDCTFWYTQEYVKTSDISGWHTWVGTYRFPNCGIYITKVAPSSGPNGGNIPVVIYGAGFNIAPAQTQVTFGGQPALVISCTVAFCIVVAPADIVGNGQSTQVVDVQATANGYGSNLAQYTYQQGVNCNSSGLSCTNVPAGFFPNITVTCPAPANFYFSSPTEPVAATNTSSFTGSADDLIGWQVVACVNQQPDGAGGYVGGSCSTYPAYASPIYCGPPPPQPPTYCTDCEKTHGKCSTLSNGRKFCVHQ
jgi:IPT/TIG domain